MAVPVDSQFMQFKETNSRVVDTVATDANSSAVRTCDDLRADHRFSQRYAIVLELEFKLLDGRGHVVCRGIGISTNLSSGGILFGTTEQVPVHSAIEIVMRWPVPLENGCPLNLIGQGFVVRSGKDGVAMKMTRCEFRTAVRSSEAVKLGLANFIYSIA